MLSFADAVGNYFNAIGRLGGIASNLRTYQNTIYTIMTDTTYGVSAQTKNEMDVQAIMGDSYLGILSATGGSVTGTLQTIASAYLNRLIYRDNPRLNQTLQNGSSLSNIGELIRQMGVEGATVRRHTVSATTTAFTGSGNSVLNVSVLRASDGLPLENLFAENLTVVCTSDSYLNNATPGNEPLVAVGRGAQGDPFSFDWPLGSNSATTINNIDGNSDNSNGNLLTNSGFEAFTSNIPDNWTLMVGTAGVDFNEEDTLIYDPVTGGKALKITGDGTTLAELDQLFNDVSGTGGSVEALTQYSVCLFLRRDGVAASTGVLTVDLWNGLNVVNDENGIPNSFTVDLTTLSMQYAAFTGVFRLPLKMPDTVTLRLRLSTALQTGRSVYLDKLSLGQMTQTYASGPYIACHAGSSLFVTGDYATIALSNSRGAGGSLDTFQTLMSRLFPEMISNGITLPSSTVPNISDGLIH